MIDDELQNIRIKNEEELNKLCKTVCLCIGWTIVLFLFIYMMIIIIKKY